MLDEDCYLLDDQVSRQSKSSSNRHIKVEDVEDKHETYEPPEESPVSKKDESLNSRDLISTLSQNLNKSSSTIE